MITEQEIVSYFAQNRAIYFSTLDTHLLGWFRAVPCNVEHMFFVDFIVYNRDNTAQGADWYVSDFALTDSIEIHITHLEAHV